MTRCTWSGPRVFPLEPVVPLLQRERLWIAENAGCFDGQIGAARALASLLGLERQVVYRWFYCNPYVDADVADAIAEALCVHPVEIWPDWFERVAA